MLYEYLLLQQPLPGFREKMSLEDRLDEACHRKELPGIVLAANGPGMLHTAIDIWIKSSEAEVL